MLRFQDLTDLPRHPHPYFDSQAEELTIDSAPFGRMRTHYRTCGSGPPLLLVHGLMTSSYSWRYVLDRLGRDYTVIAPDLPGCGRSDVPARGSYAAAALATWIGEFQDALGIAGCRAVGNSLGGYLCMWRALDAPESFARLVNIHSPAVPEFRIRVLHAALSIPGAVPGMAWVVRRSPERFAYRNVHYHDDTIKSLEEAREYGRPLATRAGAEALVRYLRDTLNPADMAGFIARLRGPFPVPLMLVYAREDRMVPPAIGHELEALIPDAQMVWLEQTSHFAQVDSPDELVETLAGFL